MSIRFKNQRFVGLLVGVAALALLGVGCSQGAASRYGGGSYGAPAAPGAAVAGPEVQVTLSEFAIALSAGPIKAGPTTFVVKNTGQATHAFALTGPGLDTKTANLSGGQTANLTVDLKPGVYKYFCPIGTHADLGMRGELTVQ